MQLPGFSAETSLFAARHYSGSHLTTVQSESAVPAQVQVKKCVKHWQCHLDATDYDNCYSNCIQHCPHGPHD